jgi:S1-C subfamily serine protease
LPIRRIRYGIPALIEGKHVSSRLEFLPDVRNYHRGYEIVVTVLREGRQIEITVSLDDGPS